MEIKSLIHDGTITQIDFGIKTMSLDMISHSKNVMLNRKPNVSKKLIKQALANNPLETIPRWDFSDEITASSIFRQSLPEIKNAWLETHFKFFADKGITFNTPVAEIVGYFSTEEQLSQKFMIDLTPVKNSFCAFQKIFSFIEHIIEVRKFDARHLTSLHTICNAYSMIMDVKLAARLMKPIELQIDFNKDRSIYDIPTVLPASNMAEILLAMPIWFLCGDGVGEYSDKSCCTKALKLICDLSSSREFAWLYQIYNKVDRNFIDFEGPDFIPSDYLELQQELKNVTDLQVIATPYRYIANKERQDPKWLEKEKSAYAFYNDPVAFGVHKDLPYITIFRRWSHNGIFPLLPDMMATTIDHLVKNKRLLSNIPTNVWYRGNSKNFSSNVDCLFRLEDIEVFINTLIKSFEEKNVFKFLNRPHPYEIVNNLPSGWKFVSKKTEKYCEDNPITKVGIYNGSEEFSRHEIATNKAFWNAHIGGAIEYKGHAPVTWEPYCYVTHEKAHCIIDQLIPLPHWFADYYMSSEVLKPFLVGFPFDTRMTDQVPVIYFCFAGTSRNGKLTYLRYDHPAFLRAVGYAVRGSDEHKAVYVEWGTKFWSKFESKEFFQTKDTEEKSAIIYLTINENEKVKN